MKKAFILFLCINAFLFSIRAISHKNRQNNAIKIMSFNIRLDVASDAPNTWNNRKQWVANCIHAQKPDFIGMQEVLIGQLNDLKALLPEYECIGRARDDGKEAGEFSPIFYRKDKFRIQENKTFWLSETPEIPGKMGWDAVCNRVVTQGKFQTIDSSTELVIMNTHFDHVGKIARKESAKYIHSLATQYNNHPVVIMGDFNATPEDTVYTTLTRDKLLQDTRSTAAKKNGPEWTFHGFGSVPLAERPRIDYVFVNSAWKTKSHLQLFEQTKNLYPSDHLPLIVELMYSKNK